MRLVLHFLWMVMFAMATAIRREVPNTSALDPESLATGLAGESGIESAEVLGARGAKSGAAVAAQGTLTMDTQPTGAEKSKGTLTMDTNPTDGDTMTVDAKVYTFKDTLGAVDGHIKIGANVAATQASVDKVFDLSGVAGTDYSAETTAHPTVEVDTAFAANDLILRAKTPGTAGDSIATTETFTAGTNVFDAATLGTTNAGVDGDTVTIDETTYLWCATVSDFTTPAAGKDIFIGANLAAAKVNFVAAVNGSGTPGTEYDTAVVAHTTVSAAAFSGDDCVLTARTAGADGNGIETTETFTAGTNVFDAATLGTTTEGETVEAHNVVMVETVASGADVATAQSNLDTAETNQGSARFINDPEVTAA